MSNDYYEIRRLLSFITFVCFFVLMLVLLIFFQMRQGQPKDPSSAILSLMVQHDKADTDHKTLIVKDICKLQGRLEDDIRGSVEYWLEKNGGCR
jgi:hypothetical protein